MKEIMLENEPIEERAQILKDSCDKIEEMGYLRKFTPDETNEWRKELADLSIKLSDIENELASIKEEYKNRMKPLQDRFNEVRTCLKQGGEYEFGECYKFLDEDEGMVGYYDPTGHLIHCRPIKPDERQMTIYRTLSPTGTN